MAVFPLLGEIWPRRLQRVPSVVMMGSMFAGIRRGGQAKSKLFQGRSYKAYRGMGSMGAMAQSSGLLETCLILQGFQRADAEKLVPRRYEGRVAYKGSLAAINPSVMGGLRHPWLHRQQHNIRKCVPSPSLCGK